jgi:hypothetical protein
MAAMMILTINNDLIDVQFHGSPEELTASTMADILMALSKNGLANHDHCKCEACNTARTLMQTVLAMGEKLSKEVTYN